MFDRIVMPLDGSAAAEAILGQVRRLLRRQDAEVILLRAVPEAASTARFDAGKLLEEAQRYVHDFALRLNEEGARVRGLARRDPPAEAILETADREGATLIAMTTHGRSGMARWVMGSVAEKVVRGSRIPVLLMRSFGPAGEPAGGGEADFRKILVPLDGSGESRDVLPGAGEFARLFGSRLAVLHVREPARLPVVAMTVPMPEPIPPWPPPPERHERAAETAADELRAQGLRATPLAAEGDPASCILDTARAEGADLIAMATHGRSGISRWVLGSVTEKVLRGADVPLLVVRSQKRP